MTDLEEDPTPRTAVYAHVSAPMPGTLCVHTKFHRLVGAYEDALETFYGRSTMSYAEVQSAYAAAHQRKKELYEWVTAHTPAPASTYRMRLRF